MVALQVVEQRRRGSVFGLSSFTPRPLDGPLNALSFNVGYHVEHHDFPNVPWTRLKKLRSLAHTAYDDLFAFTSWTKLIVAYVVDTRYRVRHYVGMADPLGEDATRASARPARWSA